MERGSKAAYTAKQKRKARHIEEGYQARGVSEDEAERRAWATVNKQDGGGRARRNPDRSRRKPAAPRKTTRAAPSRRATSKASRRA